MTNAEREQLATIIKRLEVLQREAPSKTTYVMGRTRAGLSYRIGDIVAQLKEIAGLDDDNATE